MAHARAGPRVRSRERTEMFDSVRLDKTEEEGPGVKARAGVWLYVFVTLTVAASVCSSKPMCRTWNCSVMRLSQTHGCGCVSGTLRPSVSVWLFFLLTRIGQHQSCPRARVWCRDCRPNRSGRSSHPTRTPAQQEGLNRTWLGSLGSSGESEAKGELQGERFALELRACAGGRFSCGLQLMCRSDVLG